MRPTCGRCRRLNRTCSLVRAPVVAVAVAAAAAAAAALGGGGPGAITPPAGGGGGGGGALAIIPAVVSATGDSVVQAHANIDSLMVRMVTWLIIVAILSPTTQSPA